MERALLKPGAYARRTDAGRTDAGRTDAGRTHCRARGIARRAAVTSGKLAGLL